MKILLMSDKEEKGLWDYFKKEKLKGVDCIISCGDLDPRYLEFLETMSDLPLLYVRGNHDQIYDEIPPGGCDCLEDTVITVNGYRIAGLGGSIRYKDGTCMYTEREMEKRIRNLRRKIKKEGPVDILVTHAPAKGYGDLPDFAHQGFACFTKLLEEENIPYMCFGHVHAEYGRFKRIYDHPRTKIINAYETYVLELPDKEMTSEERKRKPTWFDRRNASYESGN
ncbi:MAG: metallophosphoesterase family protein [Erysipelotrichales bacterium]|nr:metallophosphoesterase family protein [Erysipelotrichales bacterium]